MKQVVKISKNSASAPLKHYPVWQIALACFAVLIICVCALCVRIGQQLGHESVQAAELSSQVGTAELPEVMISSMVSTEGRSLSESLISLGRLDPQCSNSMRLHYCQMTNGEEQLMVCSALTISPILEGEDPFAEGFGDQEIASYDMDGSVVHFYLNDDDYFNLQFLTAAQILRLDGQEFLAIWQYRPLTYWAWLYPELTTEQVVAQALADGAWVSFSACDFVNEAAIDLEQISALPQ